MSDPNAGEPLRPGAPEIRVSRAAAPRPAPPPTVPGAPLSIRPEHLYKFGGLLLLAAVVFHYLEPLFRVALLAYAAAIVAVILNAIVRVLPGKRGWKTAVLGLVIFGGIGALLYFGLPMVFSQVRDLLGRVPAFNQLVEQVEGWLRSTTGLNVNLVGDEARRMLREAVVSPGGGGGQILSQATGLLGVLLVPLLILFGGLYAAGGPNEGLMSTLLRAVPRERRPAFHRMFERLGRRLLGYVKGVLIGMAAVGVLSYVGYRIAGVPNALALAVLAGLTEAIPLVGPWIGGTVATVVGVLESPTTGLYAAIVAIVVQQLENNLIVPWAMSTAAEVHPFVTLFALVLFGTLFGFLGVLLSVPLVLLVATVVEVLWVERAIDTDEDTIPPVVEE